MSPPDLHVGPGDVAEIVLKSTTSGGLRTCGHRTTPLRALPEFSGRASGPGGVALVIGVGALSSGGPVRAEAIHEHRVLLVDVRATVVLLRRTLRAALPRLGVLAGHAVAIPRVPAALHEWAARGKEQRIRDPTRSTSVYARGDAAWPNGAIASRFVSIS